MTGAGSDGGPWIVLGLGNPDDEYGNTRHNAGAMVVALLAERAGAKLKRTRNRAQVAEIRDGDTRVVLARPNSYVNESGGPGLAAGPLVQDAGGADHRRPRRDRPGLRQAPGPPRRRHGRPQRPQGRRQGARLPRLPAGPRRRRPPPGRKDPADYVLEPIAKRDAEDFAVLVARAADAAMDLVHLPLERAQDRHNR